MNAGHLNAYKAVKLAKDGALKISGTQTWSNDRTLGVNLEIEPGGQLTITAKVWVCEGKRITVKPGGRLIVDGGHLTSHTTWKGIQVWGNPLLPQVPTSNQGYMELKNGAIIENAEIGVLVGTRPNLAEGPWWYILNKGGGILRASYDVFNPTTNAVFKNNQQAVRFLAYDPKYNSTPPLNIVDNLSYLYDCDFIVDNGFPGNKTFHSFIDLYRVSGIKVHGCKFENTNTSLAGIARGEGIRSMDSKFFVGGMCDMTRFVAELPCGGTTRPSSFKGLYVGVHALKGMYENRNFAIGTTTFENCTEGIRSAGVNQAFILRNNFAMSHGYGVNVQSGTGYIIEENHFYPSTIMASTTGVHIQNTGPDNNFVYLNTADELEYAFRAYGNNKDNTGETGLQFLCNTVTEENTIGLMAWRRGHGIYEKIDGIKKSQGDAITSEGGFEGSPAGNYFARNGIYTEGDFFSTHYIEYYFHGDGLLVNPEYPYYRTEKFVWPANVPAQRYCPSRIVKDPGIVAPGPFPDLEIGFVLPVQKGDSIMQQIDGGSTPTAVQTVNNFSDPGQLFDYLQNMAPWNSTEVLYAASERGLLDQNHLLEAMLANPDATKDIAFLEYLELEAPERLGTADIDSIRSSWGTVTARTELVRSYMAAMAKATYAHNTYLAYYMADSATDWTDSIRFLLRSAPLLSHKYHLVEDLFEHGLNDSAWMELDSIPYKFDLHPYFQDEHDYFVQISQLQEELVASERDIFGLDSAEMDLLWYLADRSEWIAGQRARNILQYVLDTLFEMPELVPPVGGGGFFVEGAVKVAPQPEKAVSAATPLRLFPNPASGTLNIHYAGETATGPCRFQMYSLDGRLVKEQQLKPAELQSVSIEGLPPGLYVVNLQMGEHFLRQKLVVKQ